MFVKGYPLKKKAIRLDDVVFNLNFKLDDLVFNLNFKLDDLIFNLNFKLDDLIFNLNFNLDDLIFNLNFNLDDLIFNLNFNLDDLVFNLNFKLDDLVFNLNFKLDDLVFNLNFKRFERSPEARGEDFRNRDRDRSLERRPRYSNSPPNARGWRGNRGRGRGRGRDFNSPYRAEILSPTEIDVNPFVTKFFFGIGRGTNQARKSHDDRDISPKAFRARGRGRGRGRFPARSFGSNSFRGTNRGGYRGRGFRGKSFGSLGNRDRMTPDRSRERSADREWKHDMYDSLQGDEEQPHSTTLSA
ncbi:apolipoprotein A-IV [Elysia marginata]|uniref:Apolipoprotein A-IV n=1 Tax=Elysia marginata TaxID=1093978 RepID=A0AAV4JIA6_9GAST|nr:apolipoprotein A-IV [Elysia marginata]